MSTIPRIIKSHARQFGPKPLCIDIMTGSETTWVEFSDKAHSGATYLIQSGLEIGDGVALIGFEDIRGLLLDAACMIAGVVPVTIPATAGTDQVLNTVLISRCSRFIIDESLDAAQIRAALEPLSHIVSEIPASAVIDSSDPVDDHAIEERASVMGPDLAACGFSTIMPDGREIVAAISHDGLVALADTLRTELMADEADVWTSLLPLSTPFARIAAWYCCMISAGVFSVAPPERRAVESLYLVQPSFAICDQEIAEKLSSEILSELELLEGVRGRITRWGFRHARERIEAGREPHGMLDSLADLAVERLVREIPGGALRAILIDTKSPVTESRRTFETAGVEPWFVYAPVSTACFMTVTRPGSIREGSVGRPLPCSKITVSERGELIVSGKTVMISEMCQSVDDGNDLDCGNLKSGLAGRVDSDGFVYIESRIE